MPFDNLTSARPYMREMTTALAALVATAPGDDVLRAIAAELAYRSRPAARKLMDVVTARLGARGAGFQVPITPGEPVGSTEGCYAGWHQPPAIIPCEHGEVVSVTRVTAPEPAIAEPPAKPAKPRKGKAPIAEPAPDRAPLFSAVAINGTPIARETLENRAAKMRRSEIGAISRKDPAIGKHRAERLASEWETWKRANDPSWDGVVPPHAEPCHGSVDDWWMARGGPICAA